MIWVRRTAAIGALATALAFASSTPSLFHDAPLAQAGAAERAVAEGPHAAADRPIAATKITRVPGAVIRSVDLGNINLGPKDQPGKFRAPVRGVLISSPTARNDPLIIVNHLRYPACTDMTLAYPCAKGKERRFDLGMTYLGVHLARHGYSTLITDLSPIYIPGGYHQGYSQNRAAIDTVGRLLTQVKAASAGRETKFGKGLTGDIGTTRMGALGHSRSGTLLSQFIRGTNTAHSRIVSAMSYGGAYDTEYDGRKGLHTPAMPRNIPFLGVVGDLDGDVGFLGSLYQSHHITQQRSAPALMTVIPGFGHTYINRALSGPKIDDRSCAGDCVGVKAHERFLEQATVRWFDTTMRGASSKLPLSPTSPFPDRWAGVKTRWTAITNGPKTTIFKAGRIGKLRPYGAKGYAKECYPAEPMAPSNPDDCPNPNAAIVWNSEKVTQIRLTDTSGVRLRVPGVRGATGIAVHLNPSDDRPDQRQRNPLTVVVKTADGRTFSKSVSGLDQALVNRATAESAGVYPIATVRIPLPVWVTSGRVTSVLLHAGPTPSRFDLEAIDLAR